MNGVFACSCGLRGACVDVHRLPHDKKLEILGGQEH